MLVYIIDRVVFTCLTNDMLVKAVVLSHPLSVCGHTRNTHCYESLAVTTPFASQATSHYLKWVNPPSVEWAGEIFLIYSLRTIHCERRITN